MVDEELVVLEDGVSRGVLSLDISQEFPQLSATLADSSELKSLRTLTNSLAHRDMSSVMWILLPLRIPDFLRTSSRSLNSWNVTTTGLQNIFKKFPSVAECLTPRPHHIGPRHHPGGAGDHNVSLDGKICPQHRVDLGYYMYVSNSNIL